MVYNVLKFERAYYLCVVKLTFKTENSMKKLFVSAIMAIALITGSATAANQCPNQSTCTKTEQCAKKADCPKKDCKTPCDKAKDCKDCTKSCDKKADCATPCNKKADCKQAKPCAKKPCQNK